LKEEQRSRLPRFRAWLGPRGDKVLIVVANDVRAAGAAIQHVEVIFPAKRWAG
jgi:CO/xanthine dehydrogenase Mo-binding subunit